MKRRAPHSGRPGPAQGTTRRRLAGTRSSGTGTGTDSGRWRQCGYHRPAWPWRSCKRLAALEPDWNWATCAVIASEWKWLEPMRACCDLCGIPVQMANEESLNFWRLRETQAFVTWLRGRAKVAPWTAPPCRPGAEGQAPGTWQDLLSQAIERSTSWRTAAPKTPVEPPPGVAG